MFGSAQEDVDFEDLKSRLTKLEAAVASLQAQLASGVGAVGGIPYGAPAPVAGAPSAGALPADAEWLTEVRTLKANDQLINAIKVYRAHTGVGLKEAKDAVEGML